MKPRFQWAVNAILIVLIGLVVWCIFAATFGFEPDKLAGIGLPTVKQSDVLIRPVHEINFGLNRVSWLRETVFGQPSWELLAALLYILVAYYVSKTLDYIVNTWLKKWASKTQTKLDDLLLEFLRGPIKVVTFVVLLHFGLELSSFLSKGLQILVGISLTYLLLKCVDMLVIYWRDRAGSPGSDHSFDQMLFPVIRKTFKVFIIIVATLATADNLGIHVGSILTSLSIGGLAIGLAAQDTLSNLFGAVAVLVDKPFRIGDRIKLDAVEGNVESIGLRSTRVRSLDGFLVTIPNKTMGNATIINISRRPTVKTQITLSLNYDTSTEKLKEAIALLEKIYRAHPLTADVLVVFNQFADSALNVLVVYWSNAKTTKEHILATDQLNMTVKEQFEAHDIEFAFPTHTIHVKGQGIR